MKLILVMALIFALIGVIAYALQGEWSTMFDKLSIAGLAVWVLYLLPSRRQE